MEEYLEKRVYVFRRSHNDFKCFAVFLVTSKFIFASSSVSAFMYIPLGILGVVSGFLDLIEKYVNLHEKKESYMIAYRFYKQLLIMYKQKMLSDTEVATREKDFLDSLNYLPREKYIREMKLNGYRFKG